MAIQADRVHFLNTKETLRPLRLEAADRGRVAHLRSWTRNYSKLPGLELKPASGARESYGCFNRSKTMNIFYIIGVVVVIIVVAGFLGPQVCQAGARRHRTDLRSEPWAMN